MKLVSLSENSLLLLYDQEISHPVFLQVSQHTSAIKAQLSAYIVDIVPAYASILIQFRLRKIKGDDLQRKIEEVIAGVEVRVESEESSKLVEIPVYYGPEVALDIEQVASFASVTVDEVISLHSSASYNVYATGFAPGFSYLGIVDERIAIPRKQTPRVKISRGSLGIAGQQTAIYPSDSPGGWQIIGRTPIGMIDYQSQQFARLQTGDKVVFVPISRSSYVEMGGTLK